MRQSGYSTAWRRHQRAGGDNVRAQSMPLANMTLFEYAQRLRRTGLLLDLPGHYLDAVARITRRVALDQVWHNRGDVDPALRRAVEREEDSRFRHRDTH